MEVATGKQALDELRHRLERIGQQGAIGSDIGRALDKPSTDAAKRLTLVAHQLKTEIIGLRQLLKPLPGGEVIYKWEHEAWRQLAKQNRVDIDILRECTKIVNGSVVQIGTYDYTAHVNITDISALRMFSALRVLWLYESGSIRDLAPLADCPYLEELAIKSSQPDIYPIGSLRNLRYLLLGHWPNLTNIDAVANLSNLRDLDVSSDHVKDLTPIGALADLEGLGIHTEEAEDFSFLQYLRKLTDFEIRNPYFTDLSLLNKMADLVSLKIWEEGVSDLRPLAFLKSLQRITMPLSSVKDISPLAHLPSLVEVYMAGSSVKDISALGHCATLESISLDNSQVADIRPVLELPNLKRISIRNTPAAREQSDLIESYKGPVSIDVG